MKKKLARTTLVGVAAAAGFAVGGCDRTMGDPQRLVQMSPCPYSDCTPPPGYREVWETVVMRPPTPQNFWTCNTATLYWPSGRGRPDYIENGRWSVPASPGSAYSRLCDATDGPGVGIAVGSSTDVCIMGSKQVSCPWGSLRDPGVTANVRKLVRTDGRRAEYDIRLERGSAARKLNWAANSNKVFEAPLQGTLGQFKAPVLAIAA